MKSATMSLRESFGPDGMSIAEAAQRVSALTIAEAGIGAAAVGPCDQPLRAISMLAALKNRGLAITPVVAEAIRRWLRDDCWTIYGFVMEGIEDEAIWIEARIEARIEEAIKDETHLRVARIILNPILGHVEVAMGLAVLEELAPSLAVEVEIQLTERKSEVAMAVINACRDSMRKLRVGTG